MYAGRLADTQAAVTRANPCLQVRARPTSAHTPLQNCVSRSGPRTRVHAGRIQPHRQTPKDQRDIRSGGGPAKESGQPPPRGEPASLGCGQRVSQPQRGNHRAILSQQGASWAPRRPTPTRPKPSLPPGSSRTVHEPGPAGGPRARPALLLAGPAPGPRRSSRRCQVRGGSERRRRQPARWGPAAGSRSTPLSPRAPFPGGPVGAPWGSAAHHLSTRFPQTRPKFPRRPSGELLPAGRQAAQPCRPGPRPHPPAPPGRGSGPAGPCAGTRGKLRAGANFPAAACAAAGRRLRSRAGRAGGGAGAGRLVQLGQSFQEPALPWAGVCRTCVAQPSWAQRCAGSVPPALREQCPSRRPHASVQPLH